MKINRLKTIVFFCLSACIFTGCSDDFMNIKPGKNGLIIEFPDTVYVRAKISLQNCPVNLNIPEANNSQFSVIQIPDWVTGYGYLSNFVNGKTTIQASIRSGFVKLTGSMLLSIESLGLMRINLELIPLGTPVSNSTSIILINGTVSDALYFKPSDLLCVTTMNPNALLTYGTAEAHQKLELSRRPNCLAISEDGRTIAIGQGGIITLVDVATTSVSKQFNVDGDVFDLVLGENGYCYFVFSEDYRLYYLDLESGELNSEYFSSTGSQSHLTKIKGKPIILPSTNSNSLALIDINNKIPGPEKVWYINDFTGEKLWLKQDMKHFITSGGHIYETPSLETGNYIYKEATLPGNMYYHWIDHCERTQRYFTIEASGYADWSYPESRVISYLDNGSFDLAQTYEYSDYVIKSGENKLTYANQARYVFAKEDGSVLFLIKTTLPAEDKNLWSIEKLKIK